MAVAADPPGCTTDTRNIGSTTNERSRSQNRHESMPRAVTYQGGTNEMNVRVAAWTKGAGRKQICARGRRGARRLVVLQPGELVTDVWPQINHFRLVHVRWAAA